MAGNYLDFDPAQVNRVAPGIPTGIPTRVSQFMAHSIPKAQEHGVFAGESQSPLPPTVTPVTFPPRSLKVTRDRTRSRSWAVTNLFPLRYVKPLAFLKERYEERLSQTRKTRACPSLSLTVKATARSILKLFVPSGR